MIVLPVISFDLSALCFLSTLKGNTRYQFIKANKPLNCFPISLPCCITACGPMCFCAGFFLPDSRGSSYMQSVVMLVCACVSRCLCNLTCLLRKLAVSNVLFQGAHTVFVYRLPSYIIPNNTVFHVIFIHCLPEL